MRNLVALILVLVFAGCSQGQQPTSPVQRVALNNATKDMTITYYHFDEKVATIPGLDPNWTRKLQLAERDGYSVLNVNVTFYEEPWRSIINLSAAEYSSSPTSTTYDVGAGDVYMDTAGLQYFGHRASNHSQPVLRAVLIQFGANGESEWAIKITRFAPILD